jgi:hypothetical protein
VTRATTGWTMSGHLKIIGLSVGLLLILSELTSVSPAVARHKEAPEKPITPISLQSAEASVVTGAALQSLAP